MSPAPLQISKMERSATIFNGFNYCCKALHLIYVCGHPGYASNFRLQECSYVFRDDSFTKFARFSKNKNVLPPDRHTTCAYQGVWNVSFSENFQNKLNEWSSIKFSRILLVKLMRSTQKTVKRTFSFIKGSLQKREPCIFTYNLPSTWKIGLLFLQYF